MRLIDITQMLKDLEAMKSAYDAISLDGMIKALQDAPAVDAVPVVHGRWEKRRDVIGFVRCSACHDCNIYDEWPDGKKWRYCPNCGAKMDGERRNDA